jgi:D-alanyl-D-alanine carboxypeptidase
MESGTPLYIYSITKSFLAAALLRLADRGVLSLDDRLGRWLPDAPLADAVTLRQVMTHTAGLPDYGALPAYREAVRERPGVPWSFDEFLARTRTGEPRFAPGEGWFYSNIGFMLLRRVLEVAAGRPWTGALDELVIRPLGLLATFAPTALEDLGLLAPGYSRFFGEEGDEPEDVSRTYHPGWVSHGVLVSTASDVTRFYHGLFETDFLADGSASGLRTLVRVPGEHPPAVTPSYGPGLIADPDSPYGAMFGHGGGGPGYAAFACHVPDFRGTGSSVTVAVLCNGDEGDAWGAAYGLLEGVSQRIGGADTRI